MTKLEEDFLNVDIETNDIVDGEKVHIIWETAAEARQRSHKYDPCGYPVAEIHYKPSGGIIMMIPCSEEAAKAKLKSLLAPVIGKE